MPETTLSTHQSARYICDVPRTTAARESRKMPDVNNAQKMVQIACRIWDKADHPLRKSHGLRSHWVGGVRRIFRSDLVSWNKARLTRGGAAEWQLKGVPGGYR